MTLTPWIALPGVGKILFAVAFILLARQKGGSWRYLGLGALLWIVTNLIKLQVLAPLLAPVMYQLLYVPGSAWAPGSVLYYVYAGMQTGLTEVLLAWLLLRYTRLGRVPWVEALAFGIGFGAFEALYQGVPSLVSSISALAAPQSLSEAALISYQSLNDPLIALAPATDRFAATLVHIFGNVLLFYGVAARQARWMWVSFTVKSLVDILAVCLMIVGIPSVAILWAMEGVLLMIGLACWWGTHKVQHVYPTTIIADPSPLAAPSAG